MMLYNPDWKNRPASDDWRSLDNLISWLETKNPNEVYQYSNGLNCMLSQYLKAKGKKGVLVKNKTAIFYKMSKFLFFRWNRRKEHDLPPFFDQIALGSSIDNNRDRVWNFGAALERAKSVRANNTYELAL
jgi:hypothetical protein